MSCREIIVTLPECCCSCGWTDLCPSAGEVDWRAVGEGGAFTFLDGAIMTLPYATCAALGTYAPTIGLTDLYPSQNRTTKTDRGLRDWCKWAYRLFRCFPSGLIRRRFPIVFVSVRPLVAFRLISVGLGGCCGREVGM